MPAVYHVCRRARREDIRRSMPLWAQDRVLYGAQVWASLPALLEDLVARDLLSFAIVESLPGVVPRLLGGTAFIQPDFIDRNRVGQSTLPNAVLRAALGNRNPFLSPKEVGEQNARGELHLLNFFGNMHVIDLSNPDLANFYRTSNEGYRFFHFGYAFRAMWCEVWPRHHVHELQQQGMQIDGHRPLAGGNSATLLRLTREDALANPYARFSEYFFPPKPQFAFSLGEQRLLEHALLDASDEEAAQELHVSKDGIKKRWRSIYAKVDNADPELLSSIISGTARRRTIVHYLRQHLEELRPYREPPHVPPGKDE
jgi:hypothetical protein